MLLVNRVTCITLVWVLAFVIGTAESGSGIRPKGPRDCGEVNLAGGRIEGYYAIFPNGSNPDAVDLVYCGVSEGMIAGNSSVHKTNPKNCNDILLDGGGMAESGINVIFPYANHPESPVIVYCEQELLGGGWTVFQRRDDYEIQLDFYRGFDEYGLGFGNVGTEFWLGNSLLHELTNPSVSQLYVELTSFADETKYALYDSFYVGPKDGTTKYERQYQLSINHYSGTAGDSLTGHNGMGFTTFDSDDDLADGNCAIIHKGAWWYNHCYESNLNGIYYDDGIDDLSSACWYTFSGNYESLKKTQMMTRPLN